METQTLSRMCVICEICGRRERYCRVAPPHATKHSPAFPGGRSQRNRILRNRSRPVVDTQPMCQYTDMCQLVDTSLRNSARLALGSTREMTPTMKKTPLELGKRERQIIETVQRLGEASVADVRKNLDDAPSYSAVRTMLGLLVEKGWLKFRPDGKRYLYRTAMSRERSQRTALERLLGTFFGGSAGDAMAALLDISAHEMTEEQLGRLRKMIDDAKENKRS